MRIISQPKKERSGFTLIELLTVIAIIAVLAAIIFPVFNSVRKNVRRSTCLSQMHEIYTAFKLYREDNNKYPAALLGYVQAPDGSFYTGSGQIATIEQLTYRPLTSGQKYLKDKDAFICPDNPDKDPTQVTTAVYPQGTPFSGQPVAFGPLIHHNVGDSKSMPDSGDAYFYKYDSYDVGPRIGLDGKAVLGADGKPQPELHYSLDWTGGSGDTDKPNQLKYPNAPADTTIITWCTYHAADAGADVVNVLMLSGKLKPVPVTEFMSKGPLGLTP